MAGFQTHITVSTVTGVAYGVWGCQCGAPLETCILAGGLCSVSRHAARPRQRFRPARSGNERLRRRRRPDAHARAVRELRLVARDDGRWPARESMPPSASASAEIFKRYTVHRGMWHSIPACLACGLLAFLIVAGQDLAIRLFKAGAVSLGFLSHLVLDEIWSLQTPQRQAERQDARSAPPSSSLATTAGPTSASMAAARRVGDAGRRRPDAHEPLRLRSALRPAHRRSRSSTKPCAIGRRPAEARAEPDAEPTDDAATTAAKVQSACRLSSSIVTGPSLTSSTCIIARNWPVATGMPCTPTAATNVS